MHGADSLEARRIIDRLCEAGFVAYLAGGCVRDALLGRQPKDYDVATDATPESVRELFGRAHTLAFGASFGVIGVLPPHQSHRPDRITSHPTQTRQEASVEPTEVATFRSDGQYSDGRRPDSVHYGDAKHDALRRDFTINGLFYDPRSRQVIDYVGGQPDLESGILRTIGAPADRFGEDKLRMLRAVRFATTLGFKIDPDTQQAMTAHADQIAVVSGERIGAEMRRTLASEDAALGLELLIDCRLDSKVLPEISQPFADQSIRTRYRTLIQHAAPPEFSLSLACLMLLLDDPAAALRAIAKRWRLANEETRKVSAAVKSWNAIASTHEQAWSKVQPILMDRDIDIITRLADIVVSTENRDPGGIELARTALGWPIEQLNPAPLMTGDHLRELGIPTGPHYRLILQAIREAQLDGDIQTAQQAAALAQRIYEGNA